ncbi:12688_t:CDS:2, partial [Racocetra fulgida]
VKALEALIARSLKIYVEYLIAESKREDSDYISVLSDNSSDINNQQFELDYNKINNDQQSYYRNIDQEYSISSGTPQLFKELIIEPQLRHLLLGWYIDNSNFLIHTSQKFAKDNKESNLYINVK